jgi:hypothetical protein
MQKYEADTDPAVYQGLALRFAQLGKLFQKLGKRKAVQTLIESLVVGDSTAFNEFVNELDFPMLGKCVWLRDVVDRVICTPTTIEEYRVRSPLTRLQMIEYVRILSQHSTGDEILFRDQAIVPGPFLDDLIAADLARLVQVPSMTCAFAPVLSSPESVCL